MEQNYKRKKKERHDVNPLKVIYIKGQLNKKTTIINRNTKLK